MIIGGVIWALGGIIVIVAVEAPARGRVGINSVVGMRFGPLLLSERAWTAGHRAARQYSWLAGLAMIIGGLIVVVGALTDEQGVLVFVVSTLMLGLFTALAALRAHRAASAELVAEQSAWGQEPS